MTTAPHGSDGSSRTTPAEHSGQAAAQSGPAAAPAGRVGRAWGAWRQWRRTRPFWGGLLVVLGGAEILLSEKAPLPIIVHIGLQGLAGYLIPAIMVLCGLLLLFHPVQQTFYSILAVVLALGSWITSNLGGFFVGMLLGVVGGSLAFAWQRGQREPGQRRRRPRPQREPSAGLALIRGDPPADAGPIPEDPPTDAGPGRARDSTGPGENLRGATAILALPLAPLVLSVLASPAPGASVAGQSRIPAISASPSAVPAPTASPTPSLTPTPGPSTTPSPTATPSPSGTPSPAPTHKRKHHVAVAATPAARASTALSLLTAGSAVLTGLSFDGVAQVPTVAGPVPMLKFSMASLAFSGGTRLQVTEGGHTSLAREASLGLSGSVVLYTTKISGDLNGVRVTFTPKQPPSGLRPDVTLTNVAAHQPYTTAGSLEASGVLDTDS